MSCDRKVKIILHGYLKNLYSGELSFTGNTVEEIINGMCKTTKAFEPTPSKGRHVISIVGFDTVESLSNPLSSDITELHLVPALCGGKKGGFFQVVLGAVLIAAAIWTGGATLAGFQLGISGGALGILGSAGLSMVLGGLMSFLSPAPKADSYSNGEADPEASKYLGASGNTVKIGTRVPLMYGENKANGHYISFNVDAKDVAI